MLVILLYPSQARARVGHDVASPPVVLLPGDLPPIGQNESLLDYYRKLPTSKLRAVLTELENNPPPRVPFDSIWSQPAPAASLGQEARAAAEAVLEERRAALALLKRNYLDLEPDEGRLRKLGVEELVTLDNWLKQKEQAEGEFLTDTAQKVRQSRTLVGMVLADKLLTARDTADFGPFSAWARMSPTELVQRTANGKAPEVLNYLNRVAALFVQSVPDSPALKEVGRLMGSIVLSSTGGDLAKVPGGLTMSNPIAARAFDALGLGKVFSRDRAPVHSGDKVYLPPNPRGEIRVMDAVEFESQRKRTQDALAVLSAAGIRFDSAKGTLDLHGTKLNASQFAPDSELGKAMDVIAPNLRGALHDQSRRKFVIVGNSFILPPKRDGTIRVITRAEAEEKVARWGTQFEEARAELFRFLDRLDGKMAALSRFYESIQGKWRDVLGDDQSVYGTNAFDITVNMLQKVMNASTNALAELGMDVKPLRDQMRALATKEFDVLRQTSRDSILVPIVLPLVAAITAGTGGAFAGAGAATVHLTTGAALAVTGKTLAAGIGIPLVLTAGRHLAQRMDGVRPNPDADPFRDYWEAGVMGLVLAPVAKIPLAREGLFGAMSLNQAVTLVGDIRQGHGWSAAYEAGTAALFMGAAALGKRSRGTVSRENAALREQIARVEAQRGHPLSTAERRVVEKRFEEATRVAREQDISYDEARALLDNVVGADFSGRNTSQHMVVKAWGEKPVELHVVASVVWAEAWKQASSQGRAPTRSDFQQATRALTRPVPGKPDYSSDIAQTLDVMKQASSPIDHPRYRIIQRSEAVNKALEEGNFSALFGAISPSSVGGIRSTGFSPSEVARFHTTKWPGPKVIVEYPKGMDGLVINGEGRVAKGAQWVQAQRGNEGFVPDEFVVTFSPKQRGLRVVSTERMTISQNGLGEVTVIKLGFVD